MDFIVADDLSGATEVAGIAWQAGKRVVILTEWPAVMPSDCDVCVIDSDTRLLPLEIASQRVNSIFSLISEYPGSRVFKKVDSVLRGPVAAEIRAALDGVGWQKACLVSANPSKGRTIRNGMYSINGTPLADTLFGADPTHPALSSEVCELVGGKFDWLEIPDQVGSESDILELAGSLTPETLAVGGADFFKAWSGYRPQRAQAGLCPETELWVCGSQVIRDWRKHSFAERGVTVVESLPEQWPVLAPEAYESGGGKLALELEAGVDVSVDSDAILASIRKAMSDVFSAIRPAAIYTEGGATAHELIAALEWRQLSVTASLGEGVVAVSGDTIDENRQLVIKPGSYPWPDEL
ncbi:MAG: four-carbon acid sugar kinase family protein [Verrucomicrobiota bacterium]